MGNAAEALVLVSEEAVGVIVRASEEAVGVTLRPPWDSARSLT